MKNTFFLLLAFVTLTASKPLLPVIENPTTFDIATALSEDKIELTLLGNDESPHYYQPIVATIKNTTNQKLIIHIKNGQIFKSTDPEIQDIIVTQEEFITLDAHQSNTKPIFGMCVQQYNSAPYMEQTYSLGEVATGNLATLAGKIQEKQAFSIAAQNSVWAVTDGNDLTAIDGFIAEESDELRVYVADLLNVPDPVIIQGETVTVSRESKVIQRSVGGNFKYNFSKTSAVTIGMFNSQNIVVKELYNNPETPAGEHKLSYEFDTLVYPEDTYYIRLIIDGQIKINFKMNPRRS